MRTLGQSLRSYPARGQRPLQNFKNSTSIPGKQALPVGRSSENNLVKVKNLYSQNFSKYAPLKIGGWGISALQN